MQSIVMAATGAKAGHNNTISKQVSSISCTNFSIPYKVLIYCIYLDTLCAREGEK